jgi:hypothetical protein
MGSAFMGSDQYMSVVERAYRFAPRMGQVRAEFESLAQVVESLQPTIISKSGQSTVELFTRGALLQLSTGRRFRSIFPMVSTGDSTGLFANVATSHSVGSLRMFTFLCSTRMLFPRWKE